MSLYCRPLALSFCFALLRAAVWCAVPYAAGKPWAAKNRWLGRGCFRSRPLFDVGRRHGSVVWTNIYRSLGICLSVSVCLSVCLSLYHLQEYLSLYVGLAAFISVCSSVFLPFCSSASCTSYTFYISICVCQSVYLCACMHIDRHSPSSLEHTEACKQTHILCLYYDKIISL